MPAREWLRFCAAKFSGVEVNATFYRLQSVETFRRWRDDTPANFRFAIKANRSERELLKWAGKVRRWTQEGRDVHVYFDNDAFCDAPFNAMRLLALVSEVS